MKIAVLSDIHVGLAAKSQDLCPVGLVKRYEKTRFSARPKEYIKSFVSFVKREKLSADYLLIPGDVTDAGHPLSVELASNFLETVRKALSVDKEKMLFVPGNHDSDWGVCDKKDTTGVRFGLRYSAFKEDKYVFSRINKKGHGDLLDKSFFKLWKFKDLIVLGYNTSSTDLPESEPHAGEVVMQHIKEMDAYLKRYNEDKRLRICLIHHHLKNYSWPTESGRDFSIASNAVDFLQVLDKHHFDFIIHGHRHHSFLDAKFGNIPILCAGSFSAQVATAWEGKASNQFHLIDIAKTVRTRSARGVVKSWSNTVDGWIASEDKAGSYVIGHERGFGISLKDHKIAQKVEETIRKFARRNVDFWWKQDVVSCMPELKYLIESRDDIRSWCSNKCLDSRKWEVFFVDEKNDTVFMRKKGGRK